MTTVLEKTEDASSTLRASVDQVQGQLAEFDKISAGLAAIERDHPKDVACAVSTPAGMKQALAGRAAWRDPRIAVEKVRKAAKAPVLALGRNIDSFAEELTAKLLLGESHYDDQIKAEESRKAVEKAAREQAEREAAAALGIRIEAIRGLALRAAGQPVAAIVAISAELADIEVSLETFGARAGEAEVAKQQTGERIAQMLAQAREAEAEKARLAAEREELARQRAEQEQREAAERARVAAEQKAAADRLAAERQAFAAEQATARAEAKKRDDADRARRDEEDRVAREARAVEEKRIADARAMLENEQRAARAADEAKAAAARKVEQDRIDAEAAAERKRLDDDAAALRAEQQRVADEARAQAQAEAKKAARAAAKLATVQKAGPRLLEALKIAVPHMPQGDEQDGIASLIAEVEGGAA